MNCPHCAHGNPEDSKFCNQCGNAFIPIPVAGPAPLERSSYAWGAYIGGGMAMLFLGWIVSAVLLNMQSAMERSKLKRTLADVKTLANVWETYFVDHNTYCPRDGTMGTFAWGNIPSETLQQMLCPTYISSLPTIDAWGHPIQFAVRCMDKDHQYYGIRSAGPDGLWAPDKKAYNADQFHDYDVVLINGAFLMSAEGYCPP
jgi:hypothetical protein